MRKKCIYYKFGYASVTHLSYAIFINKMNFEPDLI